MSYNPNCSKCGKSLREIGEFPLGIRPETLMKVVKSGQRACISCLETGLGRRINRSDFTNAKVNRQSYGKKSAKVLNRMR